MRAPGSRVKRKQPGGDSRPRLSVERSPNGRERGYILLTLLLMVALVSIVAATAASGIAFTIRRDREEELIHRGAEYSRAIRRYTKKMGRYPLRIEDLENTDGQRFLRKRFKDPITGKDFKLLHMNDLQRVGIGGLSPAAVATPVAQAGIAQAGVAPAGLLQGGIAQAANAQGTPADNSGANASTAQAPFGQGAPDPQFASPAEQSDPAASNPAAPDGKGPNPSGFNSAAQPLSGGVIVGVASASRHESIREFNRKNHYSDWLFFYDPAYDRGFPINGPTPLTMPTANLNPQQPATSQAAAQPPASPQPETQ
jgi:type II secretory pathway pseudopilin PulG